ncbi:2-methylaconitate cis-trans isomerase PrpF family protein, partial [Acidaminococcus sp.]|uniref:2-methylaconitate cis-trans isomerase PrpF family protein n=1 Tax=Acidaminococcus sp. TaxID=1872103 RepID=UPI003AB87131
MTKKIKLPVTLMRGGTSKGAYLLRTDMPPERKDWDRVLLKLMGSPDRKQIDGLGGSQSVTSKVAIVERSSRPDADVDYTFAQVSVDKPVVSYGGNCGNISSGVGPFAIEEGLVTACGEETTVRVFNTNTKKIIVETVKTSDGQVCYDGDYAIAGVPGTAAPIKLSFLDPSGTLGKGILPTGHVVDELEIPDFGRLPVSIVDAANPLVFVRADSIKMKGTEQPEEINKNEALLRLLECIRGQAAVLLGLTDSWEKAAWETPGIPKMTIVAPPADYMTAQGTAIKASEIDLLGRMMSMQKAHPSYA